jgi:hypothetical protein
VAPKKHTELRVDDANEEDNEKQNPSKRNKCPSSREETEEPSYFTSAADLIVIMVNGISDGSKPQ